MIIRRFSRVGYVPFLVGAMVIMFVRTLLAARLLDVPEFGKFGIGMLVSNSFCMLSCLGFYLLLQRDLPMLITKGCVKRGLLILNQALLLGIGSFLAMLSFSFAGIFTVSPGFFMVSLLNGLAQQVFLVVSLHSRSQGKAMRFACDNLQRAVWVIIAIGLSGWLTGAASVMVLVEALITLAVSIWIYTRIHKEATLRLSVIWIAAIKSLRSIRWTSPLTLLAVSTVGFLMLNGDRWIAASVLNHEDFAMYAFAGIVLLIAQSLQSVINVSVFPHLAQTFVIVGKRATAFKAIRFSIITLTLSILLSAIAYSPVNYIIEVFFPKYIATHEFIALFFLAAALYVSDFLTSYLIIAGRERQLLMIRVSVIILSAIFYLIYSGLDFSGIRAISIAWVALIVSTLNFLGCFLSIIVFLKTEP